MTSKPCPVCAMVSTIVSKMDADILVKSMGDAEQRAQANAVRRWKAVIEAELRKGERKAGRYEVGV